MPDGVTVINVNYVDNGEKISQPLKFKGEFGFKIDGREYKTNNGQVYESKTGKTVRNIDLPKTLAYQFIGMANTAELAQDYTFSEKDMKEAKQYFSYASGDNTRINSIMGTEVTSGFKDGGASYNNGVYSTQYRYNVSIWQIK